MATTEKCTKNILPTCKWFLRFNSTLNKLYWVKNVVTSIKIGTFQYFIIYSRFQYTIPNTMKVLK